MVENATPNGADSLPKFQGLAHGLCLRIACGITKAVVGYLFLDVFLLFFPFLSFLFFPPSLPFPLSFRRLEVAPQIELWGALLCSSPPGGENNICSHQTRSVSNAFWLFRAHGTCLVAANVVLFLFENDI